MKKLSVVIPVYKAEGCLDELHRRLVAALESLTDQFEILLVEDCGADRSWDIIKKLSQKDPRVKGLKFSRNFGQHYGITAGLDVCDGDWVVVMDCDLQDRPEEIPKLYAKALEGYDVVLARRGKRSDPWIKRCTSKLFYSVFGYLADVQYDAEVGNFRMISKKVVESFRGMRERLRFFGGLVDWMGYPTASIDVQHDERFSGKTSYTFSRLWKLAIETIIAYSDKPLRMAVKFGFMISSAAMLYGLFILYKALVHGVAIAGWSSLMVSIYFIGGVIISMLGIIGVYVGKSFDEVKRRPLYVVHETAGMNYGQ